MTDALEVAREHLIQYVLVEVSATVAQEPTYRAELAPLLDEIVKAAQNARPADP